MATQSDIETTRERMLLAAGPVFAEKGYHGATVRDLCKAAGVNVASVNYHFGDKLRLYIETVKLAQRSRAKNASYPVWSVETPPEEKLRGFIGTLMARMLAPSDQPWQSRLMMREILQPTEACRELVAEQFRPQFEALLAILRELAPAGTPLRALRQMGFSVVGQCLHYRFAGEVVSLLTPPREYQKYYGVDALADQITQFSLRAVRTWSAADENGQACDAAPSSETLA
ncbi:DUF1956 domain-containing protein [Lignipirellula cremea]|uniref:Putative DNA-binding transcriptional regulator n=1 Tax=Lignipirellula cremea TaxID=2528010 RepID=A0A518DZ02_9BACT|nr:DUF1956 domain-containing protein [Lignipirellula cremea]QDU97054.1 putative DNA-binding transcriptional regulator [Lignipirellula cremea]